MDTIYGKIIDITSGQEIYIKEIPLVLGRYSKKEIDDKIIHDSKSFIGKTIGININKPRANQFQELKDHKIKNKLILTNCKRIFPYHLILYYKDGEYKLQILGSVYINSKPFPQNQEDKNKIVTIRSNDKIAFDCQLCPQDHLFTFIFSSEKDNIINKGDLLSLENNIINGNVNLKNTNDLRFPKCYSPDNSILKKWTIHEKDSLKKYLLLYGYNRWNKIRINSGGVLNEKSNLELKVMSNSFIRCIIELLPSNKENIKEFLLNLIEEKNNEPYILPSIEDWGNLIKKSALIWGKRIQLLYIINQTIEKFKNEIISNKNLHENFQIENINEEEENSDESKINTTNDIWDNLLNFLPSNIYFGHKPCFYWERIHDIDLLRGTYKYGYANYSLMRKDTKFSFYILDKNSFQEFPNANSITRRLKIITQIIMKNDNIKNGSDNDKDNFIKESTIFSLDEKNNIINYLINFGIPINSQGKSDFNSLKEKLLENNIIQERKNEKENYLLLKNFDELINKLKTSEENLEEEIKRELYSDNDGFNLDYETTDKLIKNLNLFDFIRKNIISQNFKLFNDGLKRLKEETKKGNSIPEKCKEDFWDCAIHDKALISYIEEKGLISLNNGIKENQKFKNIPLTSEEYLERVNYLCKFFLKFKKNTIPKNSIDDDSSSEKRKIGKKIIIKRDEEGNIIFPIEINPSLTILNLGKIEYTNYNYHSKSNLFPIGFKSIREHQSMFHLDQRAKYTCEILDGGNKPLYKLTSSEDPNNPIIRDSSTACWSYVCNKINDLQDKKRKKVTVSGTERFGLCEKNVVKLLQSLPGADKCPKYEKKIFDD
jgi:hypothetical protein